MATDNEWDGVPGWNAKMERLYQQMREQLTLEMILDEYWKTHDGMVFISMVVAVLARVRSEGVTIQEATRDVVSMWRREWSHLPGADQVLPAEHDVGGMAWTFAKAPDIEWAVGEVEARCGAWWMGHAQ